MQNSLWIIFLVIAGFMGFLIGYSQPQYEPPEQQQVSISSAQPVAKEVVAKENDQQDVAGTTKSLQIVERTP